MWQSLNNIYKSGVFSERILHNLVSGNRLCSHKNRSASGPKFRKKRRHCFRRGNNSGYTNSQSILAHSCWNQWMRCCGDVVMTEVVDRRRKLNCGPWTEVVSHANLPHLVKVKINFDEAQKTHVERNKMFLRFNKNNNLNHISELLKMQLESRSRNVHTKGTRSGFISTHAEEHQR